MTRDQSMASSVSVRLSVSREAQSVDDPSPPNGFKQTEIGPIPEEWDVVRIVDTYKFTTKPRGLRFDDFKAIPFVPMDLVPQGKMYFTDHILKRPDEISSGTYFEPNDILIAKITPSFENGKQGIVPRLPTPFGVATTEVIPVAEIANISSREFLFYYLLKNDVRDALASKMEGSTGRQRLRKDLIEELRIPFPPLPEQRAIAHVLSKIQAAAEAQAAIAGRARELKRALMAKLFTEGLRGEPLKETEIGVMPEGWEVQVLGQVVEIVYGAQAAVANANDPSIGTPILTNINITNDGLIDLSTLRYYKVPDSKRERLILRKGDLLFNWRSGSQDHVGKTALFDIDGKYTFASFILRFRTSEKISNSFLRYYLYYIKSQGYFAQYRQQSSVNSVFNASAAAKLLVVLPPLDEQREIARILQTVDTKIAAAERKRAALEELFRAMLGQLMTGRVRVKGRRELEREEN